MKFKHAAIATLALAGATAGGLAQAQEPRINWSVTIGAPFVLPLPRLPVLVSPAYGVSPGYGGHAGYGNGYGAGPVYGVSPGYVAVPPPRYAQWGDRDRDGIPNRYDRVYNPRWDRDGDGIPNRYDRDGRNGRHDPYSGPQRAGDGAWRGNPRDEQRGDYRDDRRDDTPQPPRRGR